MSPAPKLCSHIIPGVGTCGQTQPCELHPKVPWQGSTRRTELPPDWERRRRRVLARDQICTDGRSCNGLALSTECHHRESKHDHSLENLAGVCHNCHSAITSEQAIAARRLT